jgi:hypothetical protein
MKKNKMYKQIKEWAAVTLLTIVFLSVIFILPAVVGAVIIFMIASFTVADIAWNVVEWWIYGRYEEKDKKLEVKHTISPVTTIKSERMITREEVENFSGDSNVLRDVAVDEMVKEITDKIKENMLFNQRVDDDGNLVITTTLKVVDIEKENGGY